jgi:serine/threonine protein kinase
VIDEREGKASDKGESRESAPIMNSVPFYVQHTVSHDIKLLIPSLGRGRFGDVYLGVWCDQKVAIKTCRPSSNGYFENELLILDILRHKNILRLITVDYLSRRDYIEKWLVIEYHEHGSLYEYLQTNSVSVGIALAMCISICDGLAYTHKSIDACKSKPPLAHCDFKSKNVLVKRDLTCCISNFGLSLVGTSDDRVKIQGGYLGKFF